MSNYTNHFEWGGMKFMQKSGTKGWFLQFTQENGRWSPPITTKKACDEKEFREWIKVPLNTSMAIAVYLSRKNNPVTQFRTNEQLLDEWLNEMRTYHVPAGTIAKKECVLNLFFTEYGLHKKKPEAVTVDQVNKFLAAAGNKRNYKIQTLTHLKTFFGWLKKREVTTLDVTEFVRVPKNMTFEQKEAKRTKAFTHNQVEASLALLASRVAEAKEIKANNYKRYRNMKWSPNDPNRDSRIEKVARSEEHQNNQIERLEFMIFATIMAYNFGLRLSDCMTAEKLSFQNPNEFVVWTLKKNTRIRFPLTEQGIRDLMRDNPELAHYDPEKLKRIKDELMRLPVEFNQAVCFIPDKPGPLCFPHMAIKDHRGVLKKDGVLAEHFTKLYKALGFEGYTFHSLRHTCARRWRSLGMSLDMVAQFLGHGSTSSTLHYTGQ